MTYKLDHVVVHVENLENGIAAEKARGFNTFFGGVHASGTTHNALTCFADGSYIELLALTGNPPRDTAAMDFSAMIKGKPEGIVGWAITSTDLDADVTRLRAHGVPVSDPSAGQRQRADGVVIQWRMVLLPTKMPLLMIQDVTLRSLRVPHNPAICAQPNGKCGIDALTIPAGFDEPTLFVELFGKAEEKVGGDKVYTLESSRLIISPLVQQPEIQLAGLSR